ncbi:hypothetical protein CQ13_23260 [Bradyrhizobium retamae]|uniref:Uncharacterized protein n=1 Tax=Bradyrhizobium retamae TaxID=1300035 RepID=A0A0R3N0T1_9BRAD|nr:hypothetical protein CQ13_23260 [Bradyrhizobium retamae]
MWSVRQCGHLWVKVAMSEQSETQEAEKHIRVALRSGDAMLAMLSFYEMRSEAERLVFVRLLAGRVIAQAGRAVA